MNKHIAIIVSIVLAAIVSITAVVCLEQIDV